MKKVLFVLLVIGLSGCSKNDDNVTLPLTNGNIIGKWYQKETIVDNAVIPYDDHEPCGKDYIEFYDENKIKSIDV